MSSKRFPSQRRNRQRHDSAAVDPAWKQSEQPAIPESETEQAATRLSSSGSSVEAEHKMKISPLALLNCALFALTIQVTASETNLSIMAYYAELVLDVEVADSISSNILSANSPIILTDAANNVLVTNISITTVTVRGTLFIPYPFTEDLNNINSVAYITLEKKVGDQDPLQHQRRAPGEKLGALAMDIACLARRVYSDEPSSFSRQLAPHTFLHSLQPPPLRHQVCLAGPRTLEEAVNQARELRPCYKTRSPCHITQPPGLFTQLAPPLKEPQAVNIDTFPPCRTGGKRDGVRVGGESRAQQLTFNVEPPDTAVTSATVRGGSSMKEKPEEKGAWKGSRQRARMNLCPELEVRGDLHGYGQRLEGTTGTGSRSTACLPVADRRSLYSAVCIEIASQGFIVAAVEHRDESASATFYYKDQSTEQQHQVSSTPEHLQEEWLYYRTLKPGEPEFPLRNQQVQQRANECIGALNLLTDINAGQSVNNVLNLHFDWSKLRDSMDLCRTAIMGHSFGGATVIQSLCRETKFKCGVALDSWMLPLDDEVYARVTQPILFINSEKFQWLANIMKMKKLDANTIQRKMITIKGTVHQSFPDFTFLTGTLIGKIFKLKGEIDPNIAIDLCNKASLAFLQRHLAYFYALIGNTWQTKFTFANQTVASVKKIFQNKISCMQVALPKVCVRRNRKATLKGTRTARANCYPLENMIRLPPEVNRILYIRNLPYKITAEEMYDIFGKYGPIRQIRVGNTPESRGTAYVVYEDIFDAKNACDHLSGFNVCNRYLVVLYYNANRAFQKMDTKKKEEQLKLLKEKYGINTDPPK
ncbi:Platelet-activating factor acetylhydrolase [Acipenser ruthenus]|uniref:Splicing factor 3B subunit 6 n=3 Tax=Acipenseroidei TaxID=186622 RepID=A0A444TYE7_ACIRT|nr:Platelet-activating factor acetylhydrolase [Acipenser ruthenus]